MMHSGQIVVASHPVLPPVATTAIALPKNLCLLASEVTSLARSSHCMWPMLSRLYGHHRFQHHPPPFFPQSSRVRRCHIFYYRRIHKAPVSLQWKLWCGRRVNQFPNDVMLPGQWVVSGCEPQFISLRSSASRFWTLPPHVHHFAIAYKQSQPENPSSYYSINGFNVSNVNFESFIYRLNGTRQEAKGTGETELNKKLLYFMCILLALYI